MSNNFEITPEYAARAVMEMSDLLNCDYETVWKKYTHEIIKMCVTCEDIVPLLQNK